MRFYRALLLVAMALECPMSSGFKIPVTRIPSPSFSSSSLSCWAKIPASLAGIRGCLDSAGENRQKQGLRCRNMQLSDVSSVARLDKDCYGGQGLWTPSMYEEELAGDRNVLLVLEEVEEKPGRDGKLVGVGALSHVLDEGSITNLAVSPLSRRQGLGSMILSGILNRARHLGLNHLYLEVSSGSAAQAPMRAIHAEMSRSE
jgi:N-acetylglutamate synthase-like GNAT family acetyltransferase